MANLILHRGAFTDGPSKVELTLESFGAEFLVRLASVSDDDMNVTYRFPDQPQAVQCFNTEAERLEKFGLKLTAR